MFNPDVSFEVQPPERYGRVQVALRVAILILLAVLRAPLVWIFAALYLLLPIVAALAIQGNGGRGYAPANGQGMHRVLHWWSAFLAFMSFANDRFPARSDDLAAVRFGVASTEPVDMGQALFRLVASIPEFLLVLLLGWVAGLLGIVAAVSVLLVERVPEAVQRFAVFYVSLQARWLAYHASLVSSHPLIDSKRWQPR